MKSPKTFEIGLYDECFNKFEFWKSYFQAAVAAIILVTLALDTFEFSVTTDWQTWFYENRW